MILQWKGVVLNRSESDLQTTSDCLRRSSSLGEHLRSLPSVCLSDYVNLDEKGGINFVLQKFAGSFKE